SRRRHTRSKRDWSSDVCSSDLNHGAWHVHTRMISPAPVSPAYFETGFPYGHDQYLSTDATCWAAMALMLALPKTSTPAAPQPLRSEERRVGKEGKTAVGGADAS